MTWGTPRATPCNPVARRAAGNKVTYGEVTSPEDSIEALDAVTYDEVRQIAADIDGEPSVACVGPHEVPDFE